MSPQQQSFMLSGGLTVADYAAALFPEIAVSLSSVLTSPAPEPAMTPRRSASLESLQLPFSTDISSLFSSAPSPSELETFEQDKPAVAPKGRVIKTATKPKAKPRVRAAPKVSNPSSTEAADAGADIDGLSAEEQRKRRDTEFLASLPQQLALKRRRTSNTKQKERILAELMGEGPGSELQSPEPDVDLCDDMIADADADEQSLDAVAALKRKKNTDAARRSRMRKILRIETLETRVSELETENSNLSQLVADMEAERAVMAQRMEEYERHLGAQAGTKPSFMA
ncbi:hypothetical protein LPJ59_003314 [Coemansia sp. RSA 2399]|nr:hypothetical protein LPJ59_003314 [Coemansia sp. RSA 2399]KAJ1903628.1 hypothetical protein LPJ81_002957 [Coemansia sp. IMI 209127]